MSDEIITVEIIQISQVIEIVQTTTSVSDLYGEAG